MDAKMPAFPKARKSSPRPCLPLQLPMKASSDRTLDASAAYATKREKEKKNAKKQTPSLRWVKR